MERRGFIQFLLAGGAGLFLPALNACSPAKNNIRLKISGPNSDRGHHLRGDSKLFTKTTSLEKTTVIVGAGISGLSAAYALKKSGIQDFLMVDLEDEAGGNSMAGKNAYSAYPYGAHYLTQPNPQNIRLIDFLTDKKIITKTEDGKQFYNEMDLCFDPEERLFIKGSFQEGLIPQEMLNAEERHEIKRFFSLMEDFAKKTGNDHKFFFQIPISDGSNDKSLDYLDSISFADFLQEHDFSNEYLIWYLNYCCRDDFGGGIHLVSAWAGIHYFAAHRASPGNTDPARVLTWPEGNNRLVQLLMNDVKEHFQAGCLVKKISIAEDSVNIELLDFKNATMIHVRCKSCIVATPPFVTGFILDKSLNYPFDKIKQLQHAPWLVATATLNSVPESRGYDLCWDNVAYKAKSLGYIYNQHQDVAQHKTKTVITLYMPFDEKSFREERIDMSERTEDDYKEIVLAAFDQMHQGISDRIEDLDIWTWGHGMILPSPGLHKGGLLSELSAPIQNKLFFAHTDLSGYSIFEEGFDQGCRAADDLLKVMT